MQVKSIAEVLQYFQPSLSYHLSLGSLFCLFLSGHLRQVLLYDVDNIISDEQIQLRNEFNFWNVHGIMNTSGLLQSQRASS